MDRGTLPMDDQTTGQQQQPNHQHRVITVEEPDQDEAILSANATELYDSASLQHSSHHPIPRATTTTVTWERRRHGDEEKVELQREGGGRAFVMSETEMVDSHPTKDDITTHAANFAVQALPQIMVSLNRNGGCGDPRHECGGGRVAAPPLQQSRQLPQQPRQKQQPQPDTVEMGSNTDKTLDTDDDSLFVAASRNYRNNPSRPQTTLGTNAVVAATTLVDDDLLSRALSDAGRWAFGTMSVELWVLSDDKTKLFRPDGGWWMDPTFYATQVQQQQQQQQQQQHHHDHEYNESLPIRQLFDPSSPHYEEPHPVSPSVGLAGVLWSDVEHAKRRSIHSGSFLQAATANLVQHVLDRSRNRGSSQHGSSGGGGGSISGSRHNNNSVNGSRHRQGSIQGVMMMNVLDRSRHCGAAVGGDVTLAAAAAATAADDVKHSSTSPPPNHHQPQHHQQPQPQPVHFPQHHQRPVAYRDLEAIAMDPDQPYHRRIDLLLQCGLTSAAAVAFDMGEGHQGIVIFMSHCHHHHHKRNHHHPAHRSPVHEAYWRAATDMVGAVYAMRGPRRSMVAQRQGEIDKVLRRVRTKLLCLRFMGIDISNLARAPFEPMVPSSSLLVPDASSNTSSSSMAPKRRDSQNAKATSTLCQCCTDTLSNNPLVKTTISVYHKCNGGNVPPPPPFTWEQTMWTFFGVFATLLMLTRLNEHLETYYGSDFEIVLGPFGALMTLLYGLSAAPASQPRNVVMGQAISLVISVSIAHAQDYLPLYVRQGLATAIAVAAMVKLGITHPPAGASALLFCSGDYGWMNVAFMLLGNIMAVAAATVINNMSDKRQYPIYWGLRPLLDLLWTREAV